MNSKVLLVRLETGETYPPLGILYVANSLERAGCEVKIFHKLANDQTKTRVIHELVNVAEDSDIVGFSVSTFNLTPTIEASKTLKADGKKIVWGGIHPTLLPRQCLQESCVDAVVIGEGEETFLELVKKSPVLDGIKGVGYKTQTDIVLAPPRGFLKNLDHYSPAWHLIEMEQYKKALPISTSRGCPHACAFCYNTAVYKNMWRGQSAKKVISDVAFLEETYGIEKVIFCDDNFFVDKKRAIEIANGFHLPFYADIRADDANEKLLSQLRGKCEHLFIGGESGDERILKLINKGITPEQTIDAIKACKRNDISVRLSMMLGLPFDDELSVRKTLELIDCALSIHANLTVTISIFTPFPGTPLWDIAREYNLELPATVDDWARFFKSWPWGNPIVWEPKRVVNISRICNLAFGGTLDIYSHLYKYPVPKFFGRPFVHAIGRLEKFRWRKRMFSHPLELDILDKLS